MELTQTKKIVAHIMRLLKVNYIDFPIGRTNKGNLALKFDDSGDFTMMLDSVPLSTKNILEDENNIELKKMIEKYWFENVAQQFYPTHTALSEKGYEELAKLVDNGTIHATVGKVVDRAGNDITDKVLGKKRGRPAGSKNKPKEPIKEEIAG